MEHVDVVIVGAGLSGIDAAHHLQTFCPNKRYVILEQRQRIGGTWDLFRYPGIRSDSDMLTMGYSFRPWNDPRAISPGGEIRNYIEDTARAEGIDRHIRFGHKISSASWSSEQACWTLEATVTDESGATRTTSYSCNFLFCCAGYYRYDAGYTPDFPGMARFTGKVVHPQQWPEDLDYTNKRVVVIGSGATAITLVPSMANKAAHVTMLQRSPTYVVSMPEKDVITNGLRRVIPSKWAFRVGRMKNAARMTALYQVSRYAPDAMRRTIAKRAQEAVGQTVDVATHFNPSYAPWDQRVCVIPDNDLFHALREGRASVVTDQIESFSERGIALKSGTHLDADIVVTATGLVLQPLGGIALSVDGRKVELGQRVVYKGVMISGVPNLAYVFGYINASWTLRADMVCRYVSDLLNHMDAHAYVEARPREDEPGVAPFLDSFSAGYVQRGLDAWPKQGRRAPWRAPQNLLRDFVHLRARHAHHEGLELRARG